MIINGTRFSFTPLHLVVLFFGIIVSVLHFRHFYCSKDLIQHDVKVSSLLKPKIIHYVRKKAESPRTPTSFSLDNELEAIFSHQNRTIQPSFVKYLRWHAQMMMCLSNNSCEEPSPTFVLWRCPRGNTRQCSGTGDRIRGILSALTLAMLMDKVFLLDWPDSPFPVLHAVSPSIIDWRVPKDLDFDDWPIIDDRQTPFPKWAKCPKTYTCDRRDRRKTGVRYLHDRVNLSDDYSQKLIASIGSFILYSRAGPPSFMLLGQRGWKRKFPDFHADVLPVFQIRRLLLQSLFKSSPLTESMLRQFIPKTARKKGYVAIHARTGADVGEYRTRRFRLLHKENNVEIAKRFLLCAGLVGLRKGGYVFFASDSAALKEAFANVTEQVGIHAMYSSIASVHVAKWRHRSDYGKDSEVREDIEVNVKKLFGNKEYHKFLNIFVDFFAIAGAKRIISNKSQFSYHAHVISNAKYHRTFNVSNGTKGLLQCMHMLPALDLFNE